MVVLRIFNFWRNENPCLPL